jgi:hypothetical protein
MYIVYDEYYYTPRMYFSAKDAEEYKKINLVRRSNIKIC